MESTQITITGTLNEFLFSQAAKRGFATSQDYVLALLSDLQQRAIEKNDIEKLLLEGVRAPTVPGDEAFWAERRRRVLERDPKLKT